jgi:selenocysteine lyase/cysteine desulfurase
MSWKRLFSRALAADPDRLHFAAHSHHLWPDVSFEGQVQAWQDAASLADHKWNKVMGPVWQEAQGHIARELNLPNPATIAFSSNTHDFIVRIVSALPRRPVRVLSTDGEFHSFRRQMARWVESGDVVLEMAAPADLLATAQRGGHDLIFASQILFNGGGILDCIDGLAALAHPDGPWVVIDGYHGFMAIPTDLSALSSSIFYLGGGYKYAMSGEGVCFLHAPPGFSPRPTNTGWYAEFEDLALPPGAMGYASDGRRFLGSTFDPSGLYRFNAVQRMVADEGLTTSKVSNHVTRLQQRFLSAAPLPMMTLLNPITNGPHARFLAFRGEGAMAIHDALNEYNVVTDVRGDVLRIGFAAYHDDTDIDRLLDIVTMILKLGK